MDSLDSKSVIDTIEIERIMSMIPHRYPFLLVDRVVDLVEGESATGIKNVSINETFFQGHFPSHPVMPGVLIVEAMAQTAGVVVIHSLGTTEAAKMVYFMSIESARFRKPVTPGDTLRIHVNKRAKRGNAWKFSAQAKVDGVVVADASYSAMIADL
ncbi:3-hydroxyacyl-ACP dehydratase FabZ [Alphaproteobacteria bacterium]|nr:3-hydroxyacyl-ACP dehydratase FabZ [Alphaproteobacteria bacterium]